MARGSIDAVTKGSEALGNRLVLAGVKSSESQADFWTEIILVGAFAFDLIVNAEVGEQSEAVRSSMRAHLHEYINAMRASSKELPLTAGDWERLIHARFEQYVEELQEGHARNTSSGAGLQNMCFSAYRNISGAAGGNVEAAMIIGVAFSMLMKHMPASIGTFEVV